MLIIICLELSSNNNIHINESKFLTHVVIFYLIIIFYFFLLFFFSIFVKNCNFCVFRVMQRVKYLCLFMWRIRRLKTSRKDELCVDNHVWRLAWFPFNHFILDLVCSYLYLSFLFFCLNIFSTKNFFLLLWIDNKHFIQWILIYDAFLFHLKKKLKNIISFKYFSIKNLFRL